MSKTAKRVLEQILREAPVSMARNQFNCGTLSAAPTVTSSTTAPNTGTGYYTRNYDAAALVSAPLKPWVEYGGVARVKDWGVLYDCLTVDSSLAAPESAVKGPQDATVETYLAGDQVVAVVEVGYPFNILVEEDGVLKKIAVPALSGTAGTKGYHTIDFDLVGGWRRIGIELASKTDGEFDVPQFGGFYVRDEEQCFAPRKKDIRVFIMSDSATQGRNGSLIDNLEQVTWKLLGQRDVWNGSVGSTGVVKNVWPSSGVTHGNYSQRKHDVLDLDYLHVGVMWASFNDWNTAAALGGNSYYPTIVAAMSACLDDWRAAHPNMIIIVPGMFDSVAYNPYSNPPGDYKLLNSLTKDMVEGKNDPLMRYESIDCIQGEYEGPATGKLTADGGGGNWPLLDAGDHYLPYGNIHIGHHLAQVRLQTLQDIYDAIPDINADAPPPISYTWAYLADEGATYTPTANEHVRFGGGGNWVEADLTMGVTYVFDWHTFPTDPWPGHAKTVELGTPV